MSRTAKTIGFSVPPALADEIEQVAAAEGRTKSELFREMVRVYRRERSLVALESGVTYATAYARPSAEGEAPGGVSPAVPPGPAESPRPRVLLGDLKAVIESLPSLALDDAAAFVEDLSRAREELQGEGVDPWGS